MNDLRRLTLLVFERGDMMLSDARWAELEPLIEACRPTAKTPPKEFGRTVFVLPTKRNETPFACPDWAYNTRNRVERLRARRKEWRAVATRYEKTAVSFTGLLCLAAKIDATE